MKNKINILIVVVIAFMSTGCEIFLDVNYRIAIQNETNDTIRFYGSYNYPDTAISQNTPMLLYPVIPHTRDYINSRGKKWEKVLVAPHDTMSIFILQQEVVNTYTWDEIRSKYLILKRYDLSITDLRNLNFVVTYPPTKAMKDIKQYPRYGSE